LSTSERPRALLKADFSHQLQVLDGFEKRQAVSAEFVQLFQGVEGLRRLSVYPIAGLRICTGAVSKGGDYTQIAMHL